MDALDRKILAQLQRDASLTNAQLSEKVALSPSSCLRRVKRLKADGMIDTVVALCNPAALGRGLTAIVEVYLVHDAIAKCREFMANVMREDAVGQAYTVTGEVDIVLVMTLKDMDEYVALCERLLDANENVRKFRTLIAMDRYKFETAIPVDE